MDALLSPRARELRTVAESVAREVIAPRAEEVDREARWPEHSIQALSDAGLMGLHVPRPLGGEGQGLLTLVAITETIGRACSSSALCYGMHCVGTAVIAAKATAYQRDRYLAPIAAGEHVTSLTLSESGVGSHLYLSETRLERSDEYFVIDGVKQFITSGSHADSYIMSAMTSAGDEEPGEFNMLIVDEGTPGTTWLEPWNGMGMRGNSSRGMRLEGATVPVRNLLGREGDQVWYMFDVIVPYFLMAMSGCYLGIAQAALDEAIQHLKNRRLSHTGEALADIPVLQQQIATLWGRVERTRQFIYHAAWRGDVGDADAMPALLMSKAEVAETVVGVTNDAMSLCGGIAYRENSDQARLLRDARAAHVMSPTTDLLKLWAGRTILGQPVL